MAPDNLRPEPLPRNTSPLGLLGCTPDRPDLRPSALAQLLGPAGSDVAPLPAGMLVGEYLIERKLADGGMAEIYLATHPVIGKRAAVKVLHRWLSNDPSVIERFIQEARAVNQIQHPNIVDIFSFGKLPDGRRYLVMEWLEGESLCDRLQRGPLPLPEALEILDQVASALAAAHGAGVVHRDVKPDNVFLLAGAALQKRAVPGQSQFAKLLDFGIAKRLQPPPGSRPLTSVELVVGTPGYISPEQARGQSTHPRSDVYALGAMAYEMVTGQQPFVASTVIDLLNLHLTARPPWPGDRVPGLPPRLSELVVTMMAKQPEGRPGLDLIRQTLAELRQPAPPPLPLPLPLPEIREILALPASEWRRQASPVRPLRAALALAVLMLLVGVGISLATARPVTPGTGLGGLTAGVPQMARSVGHHAVRLATAASHQAARRMAVTPVRLPAPSRP